MQSPRVQARREALRVRIIEVALNAFSQRGFEKATMTEIADALEMTGPALYHYFPTKDALLFACLDAMLDRLLDDLGTASKLEGTAVTRMRAVVQAQVRLELSEGTAATLINAHLYGPQYLTHILSDEQRDVLRVKQRALVQIYRDLIEQGIREKLFRSPDVPLSAFNVLAIVQYSGVWYRPRRGRRAKDLIDAQVTEVLRLLGHSETC